MTLHRVTMAKSRQNLAKSRPLVAIEQQEFIYELQGVHGVFHVGNVWIHPWANFAQYMDRTLSTQKWSLICQSLPPFLSLEARTGWILSLDQTSSITVGKRNYFMGYGILLHVLPVVAVLFTHSNNNDGTMKNSILHEIFSKSLFRTSRPIVKQEF